jgi:alpha-soluble NSF attachment protein
MGENLEASGAEYEDKAEKKLKGWGILGGKYEDAADLLEKAGNSFKLAKSCKKESLLAAFYLPILYSEMFSCDL